MLTVDEVFEKNENDSSSVSPRLPPSPTGEGFFDMQKAKKNPAQGGAKLKLFLDTVNHIKQIDKTSILMKFLNTFIG